jgi:hypothetical protein
MSIVHGPIRPGDGPGQFTSEQAVIQAAERRFACLDPSRWWEEDAVPGQPGDRLWLGYVARSPDEADGRYGTVIAEIPATAPKEQEASA